MVYDVQIGNIIHRGISYAELITFPLESGSFVRRGNSEWMKASDCIELTHILANNSMHMNPGGYSCIDADKNKYVEKELGEKSQEDDYITDDFDKSYDNITDITDLYQESIASFNRPIEAPGPLTAEYFKYKQKRKAAAISVCTFGLAALSLIGIGHIWKSNIFTGTSLSTNPGIGFVLKCFSFLFLTALLAIPYFIYSIFALIYYSTKLNN